MKDKFKNKGKGNIFRSNSLGGYYHKVLDFGHIIKTYDYERPVKFGYNRHGGRKQGTIFNEELKVNKKNRADTVHRIHNKIINLALANFNEHSKFVTLTFGPNVTDIRITNAEFKKFIQRLRNYPEYSYFKYETVIQFQDRGVVHYHMMSDLPYIPKAKLAKIWGNGFVRINDISNVDNVGGYLIGYMNKKINDKRLLRNKAYLISKNLDKPIELYGQKAKECMDKNDLWNKEPVYYNSYIAERYGRVTFNEFNLKR